MLSPDLRAQARCREHEGFRENAYRDTEGHWTIGFGHKLTALDLEKSWKDWTLTRSSGENLFQKDWTAKRRACDKVLRNAGIDVVLLDQVRLCVLVEMAFQLGDGGLSRFRKMLAAVRAEDWGLAWREAVDSRWRKQTPNRAYTLARILLTGDDS